MDCLLCEKSYPNTQIECPDCKNNLQCIKPYSPHLSQIIRLGEDMCGGQCEPEKFQLALKNLMKRQEIAEDEYFRAEATYNAEDLIIFEDYLNNILAQNEFVKETLDQLMEASKLMDIKKIYTALDKAKIAENLYLKAGKKLGALTKEEIIQIARKKGINLLT